MQYTDTTYMTQCFNQEMNNHFFFSHFLSLDCNLYNSKICIKIAYTKLLKN